MFQVSRLKSRDHPPKSGTSLVLRWDPDEWPDNNATSNN
jgi:hypothetical protein